MNIPVALAPSATQNGKIQVGEAWNVRCLTVIRSAADADSKESQPSGAFAKSYERTGRCQIA